MELLVGEKEKRSHIKKGGKDYNSSPSGSAGSDTESNRGKETYLRCVLEISELVVKKMYLRSSRTATLRGYKY